MPYYRVRTLYAETKQLPVSFIEALQRAKELREDADYYDEWSGINAQELLAKTKEFLERVKKINGLPES